MIDIVICSVICSDIYIYCDKSCDMQCDNHAIEFIDLIKYMHTDKQNDSHTDKDRKIHRCTERHVHIHIIVHKNRKMYRLTRMKVEMLFDLSNCSSLTVY